MKLKYTFVINEVADQLVAVPVGDDLGEFNGFIKMNDVSADMFELLKEDTDVDAMVEALKVKYTDETEEVIRENVVNFTDKLIEAGVIV
ncbi:MAG: PqqD family protein [Ruminococcaceae bacterium]|nr:PqqD family protein [Oscillospiraceae bacterium]